MTHDSSGNVKFYVNGSQQGTTQTGAVTTMTNTANPLLIGNYLISGSPNGARNFDGLTDDIQIYNNVTVSISNLYGSPCNVTNSDSGLQARWRFDNNGNDNTSNANNLTNNNSATFSTDTAYVCASPVVNFGDFFIFD
jgi:hypothetical protein